MGESPKKLMVFILFFLKKSSVRLFAHMPRPHILEFLMIRKESDYEISPAILQLMTVPKSRCWSVLKSTMKHSFSSRSD